MTDPSALVYVGALVEAQRAWSALRGHGLEAVLLDQHSASMYAYGHVKVAVREEDRERARELLEGMGLTSPVPPDREPG